MRFGGASRFLFGEPGLELADRALQRRDDQPHLLRDRRRRSRYRRASASRTAIPRRRRDRRPRCRDRPPPPRPNSRPRRAPCAAESAPPRNRPAPFRAPFEERADQLPIELGVEQRLIDRVDDQLLGDRVEVAGCIGAVRFARPRSSEPYSSSSTVALDPPRRLGQPASGSESPSALLTAAPQSRRALIHGSVGSTRALLHGARSVNALARARRGC